MNKKILILTGLIFIFINKADSQSFNKEITNFKKVINYSDSTEYLTFDKAQYLDFSTKLPYFSDFISITNDKNYKIELKNKTFIALNDNEIKCIPNTNFFDTKINIEVKKFKARNIYKINYSFIPFRKNSTNGKLERLVSFTAVFKEIAKNKDFTGNKDYKAKSVLASGTWYKLKIPQSGVYKLTFDELKKIGINSPENVRVFGNSFGLLSIYNDDYRPDDLIENKIFKGSDYILFFANASTTVKYNNNNKMFVADKHLYSDNSYIFLTSDVNTEYNNTIKDAVLSTKQATNTVTSYDYIVWHNEDKVNLAKSGRTWYGEVFDINTEQTFNFETSDIITSEEANIRISFAASSSTSSYFSVKIGNLSEKINISKNSKYYHAKTATSKLSFFPTSSNNLNVDIEYIRNSLSAKGWLDYIYINARRKLNFTGGQMIFRDQNSAGENNISEFQISNLSNAKIWEITEPTNPENINYSNSGNFTLNTDSLRKFIVFDNNSYLKPDIETAEIVSNQNLHSISENTDMIIVSHQNFLSQAEQIKEIHTEDDNLITAIITPEQIYNEFSSGMPDVSAIRDFIKMIYEKGDGKLKYLLLLGDGSYDNKTNSTENSNFIPTYQSEESISEINSYVTDDFFGLLDAGEGASNGLLDVGIGRMPVKNATEAQAAVNKIKSYISYQTHKDWRNLICFVADDENNKIHMHDADSISRYVENNYPFLNIEKVYFDAYNQEITSVGERYPEVNEAITNRVTKGALIINYTGHGGEKGLGHERVVTVSEIEKWNNPENLPVFMTATCEFSRFDNYKFLTAGERVFLNPEGGAIAMFTTTRLVYISPNFYLNSEFYKHTFSTNENGKPNKLGDILRLTKNNLSGDNKLNFTLLGDPALCIGYAENNVKTLTVNNKKTSVEKDTLNSFEKVTVTGEITDKNNNKISNFNGIIYQTIYDKSREVKTLSNDGEGEFLYQSRDNIIYKGKSTVTGGEFTFSFVVPKDIMQNIDIGKISYYAVPDLDISENITEAKGSFFDFYIGAFSKNYIDDNTGPEIKLYMNDTNFKDGGVTDINPTLLAVVSDENGINTAQGSIGHDIVGILDDDLNNILILNEDYQADIDTYKSGTIRRKLHDLPVGEHKITVKLRDVYNNVSEEELDFRVIENNELILENLMNYPNPFSDETNIFFEHNQVEEDLQIEIFIYSLSGSLVNIIKQTITPEGYRSGPFVWNPKTQSAGELQSGMYIYKVQITAESGKTITKSKKMIYVK